MQTDDAKRVFGLVESRVARSPEELVELFTDDVWRFASSQVSRREDAEDIVMEVFAAGLARFHKLRDVPDQRLWLLGVARRKLVDSYAAAIEAPSYR